MIYNNKDSKIKIALSQINPILGDFNYNLEKILKFWNESEKSDADIVVFPECAICGYNPEDLVLRNDFIEKCHEYLSKLIEYSKDKKTAIVIGSPRSNAENTFNSAFFIFKGDIIHIHDKIHLPNYGVFDEKRVFSPGDHCSSFSFKNWNISLLICEDIWSPETLLDLKKRNVDLLIVINASPYSISKYEKRIDNLYSRFAESRIPLIYLNQVGLQDSVIYDGKSLILAADGNIYHQMSGFEEELYIGEICKNFKSEKRFIVESSQEEEIYSALILSLKDYLYKNNFRKVILGFSSGIDSTFTATVAIDAVGLDNVILVMMPSKFTSKESFIDAENFILNNNIKNYHIIDIESIKKEFIDKLLPVFDKKKEDSTEENLQSRIRGTILMSIANKHGYLLLSTGNKSEMATGYATLYGDMNGGYNILKDLYKTQIFKLSNWRNKNIPKNSIYKKLEVIPDNIIKKPPTAELRENQRDEDSLTNYNDLDKILYLYIEEKKSKEEIIELGFSEKIVEHILNLVRISQFKRQQSTLGPKISDASFDKDWRYPVTNKFY